MKLINEPFSTVFLLIRKVKKSIGYKITSALVSVIFF